MERLADGARRVLVLGGTGNFGARISRRLAARSDLQLVVSSRTEARARSHADDISAVEGAVGAVALDQSAPDLSDRLRSIAPDVVIHTAGPYQGQDYSVAQACIDAGCHYVDLADGRQFVSRIDTLDEAARHAGVTVISGASTLPTLPAAVIDAVRDDFDSIESVESCIAPAHRTPRGPSTVRAVLSYCGRPFDVPVGGQPQRRYGWQDLRWFRMPGLGLRLRAACDVPDFEVLPKYVPGLQSVEFHAALEVPWEHMTLWLLAWLTRFGLVRRWDRHAGAFVAIGKWLQFLGTDRGGMRVRVRGTGRDGRALGKEWRLIARYNHGPEIPCTPSIVIAEKLLAGRISPGARPCVGLLSLDEFEAAMSDFNISTNLHTEEG